MPLTGVGCVSRIYTDLGVFLLEDGKVTVRETFGVGFDELAQQVDVELTPAQ